MQIWQKKVQIWQLLGKKKKVQIWQKKGADLTNSRQIVCQNEIQDEHSLPKLSLDQRNKISPVNFLNQAETYMYILVTKAPFLVHVFY